ncbi:MAG: 16S rRNA (guanine(527)-N(7))-methyltransferase RsmG [Rhodospirillales bacterium]|nr:16S rRNA (guanine(527)-N(7))-methyltransferase RsmG [Rhodospirillales bacterium]
MDRAAFADAMNVDAPEVLDRLEAYLAHLEKWQRAINLVGSKTLNDPWRRHILDSAQLFEYLPDLRPLKIADLGSGAGLPGLVLAIMTGADVHMLESDQRKATFIREAARLTETNVTVHARRIEDVPALNADVVTARALAPMDRLLPWVYRHLKNGGKSLLLKGADAEEELTLTAKRWTMKISRKRSLSDASGTVLILDDLAPVTDV